jgi:hypothetical protein
MEFKMSLRDKIQLFESYDQLKKSMQISKCITIDDFDEAVELYLDARDHPEKHPELTKEFIGDMLVDVTPVFIKSFKNDCDWHDFCFKKIISGDD